jgi:hypothetical protein
MSLIVQIASPFTPYLHLKKLAVGLNGNVAQSLTKTSLIDKYVAVSILSTQGRGNNDIAKHLPFMGDRSRIRQFKAVCHIIDFRPFNRIFINMTYL